MRKGEKQGQENDKEKTKPNAFNPHAQPFSLRQEKVTEGRAGAGLSQVIEAENV
jgi:hypothetical protein